MSLAPDFSPESSQYILSILYGFKLTSCIHVAAKLNIAEHLFEAPQTIEVLAQKSGAHPPSLYRLLKVLAGERIFRENADKQFEITPEAHALHKDAPGSIKPYFMAIMGEHARAFENLLHAVMTGNTAFDHYYQEDVWSYYSKNPQQADNFNKAMAGLTQYYAAYIVPAYDFDEHDTVVDIGGGNGALVAAIMGATEKVSCIIVDAEFVTPHTQAFIEQHQLGHRCKAVAGNFFEAIPARGDLYLLKYILHSWSDEACLTILKNCAEKMRPGDKLMILESILPQDNSFHTGRYVDITMLACTKGKERSEQEFRTLTKEAGLTLTKITSLSIDEICILEAIK